VRRIHRLGIRPAAIQRQGAWSTTAGKRDGCSGLLDRGKGGAQGGRKLGRRFTETENRARCEMADWRTQRPTIGKPTGHCGRRRASEDRACRQYLSRCHLGAACVSSRGKPGGEISRPWRAGARGDLVGAGLLRGSPRGTLFDVRGFVRSVGDEAGRPARPGELHPRGCRARPRAPGHQHAPREPDPVRRRRTPRSPVV